MEQYKGVVTLVAIILISFSIGMVVGVFAAAEAFQEVIKELYI